jgi:hypothetical protein
MYKIFLVAITFHLINYLLPAQDGSSFSAGLRFQKTHNLYYENGIAFDFASQKILDNRLHFGLSYVTSRLGSAIASNALKQDNYLFSLGYYFRHEKIINPIVQLNTGFFYADMEDPMFESIPHKSLLLSVEPGVFINFNYPIKAKATLGYNIITSDGTTGSGTVYPLYFQLSIFYQMNFKN